jgi:hypothetical protein
MNVYVCVSTHQNMKMCMLCGYVCVCDMLGEYECVCMYVSIVGCVIIAYVHVSEHVSLCVCAFVCICFCIYV